MKKTRHHTILIITAVSAAMGIILCCCRGFQSAAARRAVKNNGMLPGCGLAGKLRIRAKQAEQGASGSLAWTISAISSRPSVMMTINNFFCRCGSEVIRTAEIWKAGNGFGRSFCGSGII